MKRQKKSAFPLAPFVRAAVCAALYVGLTLLFSGVSYLQVQFRIAECLTVLPFFFPETIFGLFFGCLIANFFSPLVLPLDIVLGSTATLLAAVLTARCRVKWLAPLPPVVCNAVMVPLIFCFSAGEGTALLPLYFWSMLWVCIGQIAVCYGLGMPLLFALEKLPLRVIRRKGDEK